MILQNEEAERDVLEALIERRIDADELHLDPVRHFYCRGRGALAELVIERQRASAPCSWGDIADELESQGRLTPWWVGELDACCWRPATIRSQAAKQLALLEELARRRELRNCCLQVAALLSGGCTSEEGWLKIGALKNGVGGSGETGDFVSWDDSHGNIFPAVRAREEDVLP